MMEILLGEIIYRSREKIDLRLGLEDLYGWRLQKLPESRYLILSRHIPINVLLYVNTVRNFSRVSFVKEFNVEIASTIVIRNASNSFLKIAMEMLPKLFPVYSVLKMILQISAEV